MGQSHSRPLVTPLPVPPSQKGETPPPQVSANDAKKSDSATLLPLEPSSSLNNEENFPTATEFYGPPRLPLPIESEEYLPGSPVLSAEDSTLVNEEFPPIKNTSLLSNQPADDDDDIGDDLSTIAQGVLPSVPTIIEWTGAGSKVYVTGTFANWDKKYRLHKK